MPILPISDNATIRCDQWLTVLDELNIGAFTVDIDHRISSINYSAQALMGLKEGEVVGQDCREVFTGVPCMVHCAIEHGGDPIIDEPDVEFLNESETKHLLTRLATPIYDAQCKTVGCMTILQDHSPIADLINRIHYEERSLKMILNNLDVGVFAVNGCGYVTFFDREA